jgi:hypothetical protein
MKRHFSDPSMRFSSDQQQFIAISLIHDRFSGNGGNKGQTLIFWRVTILSNASSTTILRYMEALMELLIGRGKSATSKWIEGSTSFVLGMRRIVKILGKGQHTRVQGLPQLE